jgi:hypothetical protein
MMPDPIGVCNQALGELGAAPILSFQDGTSVATLCSQLYADTRDAVLSLHPWNFCTVYVALARLVETPPFGWLYMYSLPTQPYCLTVRSTDQDNTVPYEIGLDSQGHRVLLSDQGTVSISYTARIEDLNLWSPLAVQVLVKMVAGRLAKAITGQSSVAELKIKEAYALLPEAKRSDGREGTPKIIHRPVGLIAARHRLGGGWTWPIRELP